jgi:5-methylcytosine-specific restriction endonuclease McrA
MPGTALESSVLVLNSSLVAVDLITARRAFCLLCKAVAEVVDVSDGRYEFHGFESWREISEFKRRHGLADDDAEWVSTVSYELEVPRVVRLMYYDRYPQRTVALNRRNVFARDENRCQYCGQKFPTSELSLDHVVPLSLGGRTSWTNLVCACTECNKRKGGRTPGQARMKLRRKPVQPQRNPQIKLKLRRKKYYSWKHFLDDAYWSVELE